MMRVVSTIVLGWIPYMAPSIVAWIRRKQGKAIITSFLQIVMMNLFLG
jgi:hypothetical protein